jgi:hypothetical protein
VNQNNNIKNEWENFPHQTIEESVKFNNEDSDVYNYCRQIHHTFEQIQQLKNGRKYKFNDESTNADEDGRSIK